MLRRLDDGDWAVRQQLGASLSALPKDLRETALTSLLERHGTDPVAVDAALSGLRGSESAVLERLLRATTSTPQREAAITMLAATVVRGGQNAPIQELFQRAAEAARPEWQRASLLLGAEVALLGATMPGHSGWPRWATRGGTPSTRRLAANAAVLVERRHFPPRADRARAPRTRRQATRPVLAAAAAAVVPACG